MDFKDRKDAGLKLAKAMSRFQNAPDTIVIGLLRGGIAVAAILAKELHLPLDCIVARKIGAPHNEELAIGAIAGDVTFIDQEIAPAVGATSSYIEQAAAKEKKEAERRTQLYRKNLPPPNYSGQTVILVDDGIATGATMKACIAYMRKMGAKKIIVAVPVAPPSTLEELEGLVDEIICLFATEGFMAVGGFYEDFPQVQDDEVLSLLNSKI